MSLLRTAARASVAARVAGGVHRRQQRRWAAQDAAAAQAGQAAPVPAATGPAATAPAATVPASADPAPVTGPEPSAPTAMATSTMIDQLTRLGQLRDAGVLTDEEFQQQKSRILAG